MGRGTNNYGESVTLYLVLKFAWNKRIHMLHIFRDYRLIIGWKLKHVADKLSKYGSLLSKNHVMTQEFDYVKVLRPN